jgi:carboxyl-terminal processing protease
MSGIDGLIIDLRYNTGGSMLEAISLTGIFIDYGPICVLNNNVNQPVVFKDLNRGMAYSGPLVVLVNGASASASEVFAAAIQDYNRGLIVGSETFGKATGQSIYPLYINSDMQEPSGFVKITESGLYRLDGTSHQRIGVLPDLELNDPWSSGILKEKDRPRSLTNPTIDKKPNFEKFDNLPLSDIKNRFQERQRVETGEKLMPEDQGQVLEEQHLKLTIEGFKAYYADDFKADELQEGDNEVQRVFSVKNHKFDTRLFSFSEAEEKANRDVINQIEQDEQVTETIFIISDFINLINK